MKRIAIISLATGLVILGGTGFATGDFAMQWQPVPEGWPGRNAIAYACASFELVAGMLLFFERQRTLAIKAVTLFFLLWVAALHLPRVVAAPANLIDWLGFAEISFIGLGALIIAEYHLTKIAPGSLLIRLLCGLALIVFGSTHFVFADFTAQMIPKWLPAPMFWAYLTGSGHIATGLVLAAGSILLLTALLTAPTASSIGSLLYRQPVRAWSDMVLRSATVCFALMISSFVLLLHVPRVPAMVNNRAEWTMLAIALCIQAGAWAMAAQSRFAAEPTDGQV